MDDSFFSHPVSRRRFLQMGSLFVISLLSQGIPGWATKSLQTNYPQALNQQKLIVIFLRGAADALSILVPYGDPNYYRIRNSIAIARPGEDGGVLPLDHYFGLNPNLDALLPFWKQGQVAFVVNSGSPDPTRSHFDAQDYMESGTPGVKSTDTGWMNRLLKILPNNASPTRAINLGDTLPRILEGSVPVASIPFQGNINKPIALDRPVISSAFERLYQGDDMLSKAFQEGLNAHQSLMKSFEDEMTAANRGAVAAGQFSIAGERVAQLLKKDPSVQSVFIALGGWDTHVNQGNAQGALARQMKGLGDGLGNLLKGLQSGGQLDNTTVVVMSEFGRTVRENGNSGTDHGHGNVIWILGGSVQGKQIAGHWKGLDSASLFEGRDLPVTTDFRTVFSDLLVNRYHLNSNQLQQVFPGWPGFNPNQKSLFKTL
jgi:uncharacterized protein (DUF1501 family)